MTVRVRAWKAKSAGTRRWMVDVICHRADGTRARDRKVVEGTESRARQWGERRQAVLLGELRAPLHPPDAEPPLPADAVLARVLTVAEWATRMPRYYQGSKFSSKDNADTLIRTHIVPQIGHLRLDEVRQSVVDNLEAVWRRGGYPEVNKRAERLIKPTSSKKTLNNRRMVLMTLLKYAVKCRDESGLEHLPCSIQLQKVDAQKTPEFYELAVYEHLVKTAAQLRDLRALVVVLLGGDAGLRGGEMVSLRWTDVNMRTKRLTVALATYERTTDDRMEDETKGGLAKPVPMSPRLLRALRKLQSTGATQKVDHVLHIGGQPLSWRQLAGLSWKAERAAGLPAKGLLHVLRHTYVSHLVMAGVPLRTVQEMARHADIMTTMKYAHLAKDAKEDAIKALSRLRG